MTKHRTEYIAYSIAAPDAPQVREVRFTVPGNPRPKERPRGSFFPGQKPKFYTPQRTKQWEADVATVARLAMAGEPPIGGPVALELWIYRKDAIDADGDNLEKAVSDGMNRIVYLDDSQILDCHRYKRIDRHNPRAEIRVWELVGVEMEVG